MMTGGVLFALLAVLGLTDSLATAPKYSDEYLDTVVVKKKSVMNDYMTIGVNYGVSLSQMAFNPTQSPQAWLIQPNCISIMFTRYEKMFGYMPYFGFEAGFSYGHSGFKFKPAGPDSETIPAIGMGNPDEGLEYFDQVKMDVFRVPVRAKFHYDIYSFRIMADVGAYAGWRRSVQRNIIRSSFNPSGRYADNWTSYDIRFDYGMEGGAGIALLLDPVELHLNALFGWSWNSIFKPDSSPSKYNNYYYRYAYPLDLMITFGIHFQLTKRNGKTTRDLRREAYENVYGNTDSKGRE